MPKRVFRHRLRAFRQTIQKENYPYIQNYYYRTAVKIHLADIRTL